MKISIKTNVILVASLFTLIFLGLPLQAHADQQEPSRNYHKAVNVPHQATPAIHEGVKRTDNRQQPNHEVRPVAHPDQQFKHNHDGAGIPVPVDEYVNVVPTPAIGMAVDSDGPAFGTYVNDLPDGSIQIYINGQQYYYYQGSFLKQTFSGYEVIDPSALVTSGIFNIGFSNSNGAYTQVVLNATNNGFVGPQGEFYTQFPSIQQLQTMYAQ